MNFQSKRLECVLFAAVLIFFVLPPIFISAPTESTFVRWNFPSAQISYAAFALVIFFAGRKNNARNNCDSINSTSKTHRWLRIFVYAAVTFAALCAVAAIFEFIAKKLNISSSTSVLLPQNTEQLIFCVMTYFCAAIYEEIIYRFYLPEIFRKIIGVFFQKEHFLRIARFFSTSAKTDEILAIVLFALAHRYLGNFALVNSVFAAIILRVCFVRTQTVLPCVLAHGTYNLLMLFLFAR